MAKKKTGNKRKAKVFVPEPPPPLENRENITIHLDDMYGDWFLDYASYVILERAVPHLQDGLKPVQRRILHSMKEKEDGRYNKVANLVGHTMQYHPHGDASIADALVNMGQKDLLVDTQGNWGNVLTGDPAAASRYIEARLSKFALDVVFNPKTTTWASSYDGRNKEPVTLPVKFPLLLAQGAEGIAVGLSAKILPHNFCELIEASIQVLRKKPVEIFPDFAGGGLADVSNYEQGKRGGRVRARARILPGKKKNELVITEIPYGVTTTSLIDSLVAANEKGKIKLSRIDDNTSENVEIVISLPAGVDRDEMEQALYAFTDCEVSIAPNCCVVEDEQPKFIAVNELLKILANQTRELLLLELEITLRELEEKWHYSSLEKIFIEKRIYRDIEECETWEAVIEAIRKGLKPHIKKLLRPVTDEDIARLTEIKIKRISKFDAFKANELIKGIEGEMEETKKNIKNITRYTIAWYKNLLKKYGKGKERKTELTTFEKIAKTQVAVATETLHLDRQTGFAGYGLKRGEGVLIGKCSRMDEMIIIPSDGGMRVSKVDSKVHVGKNPAFVDLFRRGEDGNKVYNMIYRDGRMGKTFVKRFTVGGVTRDRVYDVCQGTPGTRILWLSVFDNEKEANEEVVAVKMKPGQRLKRSEFDIVFSEYAVKGRSAKGVTLTKHKVERVSKGS